MLTYVKISVYSIRYAVYHNVSIPWIGQNKMAYNDDWFMMLVPSAWCCWHDSNSSNSWPPTCQQVVTTTHHGWTSVWKMFPMFVGDGQYKLPFWLSVSDKSSGFGVFNVYFYPSKINMQIRVKTLVKATLRTCAFKKKIRDASSSADFSFNLISLHPIIWNREQ